MALFLIVVVIFSLLVVSGYSLATRQKSANLGTAHLVAEQTLSRALYSALSSADTGFLAQNSATSPWRSGRVTVAMTEFTYALYAQTLPYATSGEVGMAGTELNNRLKKVDVTVWWWDGQVRGARSGQGRLSVQASRIVNEWKP